MAIQTLRLLPRTLVAPFNQQRVNKVYIYDAFRVII
jgi:hypothetical protein